LRNPPWRGTKGVGQIHITKIESPTSSGGGRGVGLQHNSNIETISPSLAVDKRGGGSNTHYENSNILFLIESGTKAVGTLGFVLLILVALIGILLMFLIILNDLGCRFWVSFLFMVLLIIASFINSHIKGKLEDRYDTFSKNVKAYNSSIS
jgi:hypothetical protein